MAIRPRPVRPARTVAELAARIGAANTEAAARRAADALAGIAPPPEREYRHALRGEEARHAAGGNGGPALDEVALKPGAGLVLQIGELLYGDRHTTDLGHVCAEDPRVVRRWRCGEGSGPGPTHTFLLRREVERRIARLTEALEALDDFRELRGWAAASAPPPPPPAPEVILAPGVRPEDADWFIDRVVRDTGGKPTFVRVILAARCPPRGRRWMADVVIHDGSRQLLDCDRGPDLSWDAVGFAVEPGRPEPWLYWDDATNAWARGPDWGTGNSRRQRKAEAAAQGGQV